MDIKNLDNTETVKLIAHGVHEMSDKYSKYVDEQVCKFLEAQGYKVEKTKFGMKRLKKQLQSEGKKIEIKTKNQTVRTTSEGTLEFTFSLQIELREVQR